MLINQYRISRISFNLHSSYIAYLTEKNLPTPNVLVTLSQYHVIFVMFVTTLIDICYGEVCLYIMTIKMDKIFYHFYCSLEKQSPSTRAFEYICKSLSASSFKVRRYSL